MSDEKRSDLNSDRLGAGATAGGPAVGGGSWNAMPFESLAELQEESTRNALSSLLSDCEERFLTAARLLQIANPVTDRIQESKSKGGTSLAPLYPMWHVICRRYRREFDGAQPSLFASDSGDLATKWGHFLHRRLFPRLVEEDEFVRNALRAVGLLPSKTPKTEASDALAHHVTEMTLPDTTPLWVPEEETD